MTADSAPRRYLACITSSGKSAEAEQMSQRGWYQVFASVDAAPEHASVLSRPDL